MLFQIHFFIQNNILFSQEISVLDCAKYFGKVAMQLRCTILGQKRTNIYYEVW